MDDDGFASWKVAIAAMRENRVRAGAVPPTNPQEDQWAFEGPVPQSQLHTVREGLPVSGERTPPAETLNTKEGS